MPSSVYDKEDNNSYADNPALLSSDLQQQEADAATNNQTGDDQENPNDQVGNGYVGKPLANRFGKGRGPLISFGKLNRKRKILLITALFLGGGIGGGIFGFVGFLNTFRLDHLISNIDAAAFVRYQGVLKGRSYKLMSAYAQARLLEVETDDPLIKPSDQEHKLFRANGIEKTDPLYVWYKLLRASDFEKDLLEKQGIKFTSAYKQVGNQVIIRPAVINIKDTKFEVLSVDDMEAFNRGDFGRINSKLEKVTTIFDTDKQARKAVGKFVDESTHFWQVAKRYYLRKAIYNQIGVRDWVFFENNRNRFGEKVVSTRNKFIEKSLPADTTISRFVNCLFGVTNCKTTTDPRNPANKFTASPINSKECPPGTKNPVCKQTDFDKLPSDANGNKVQKGAASSALNSAIQDVGKGVGAEKSAALVRAFAAKLAGPLAVLDIFDTVNSVDQLVRTKAMSNLIVMVRASMAMGTYTTWSIMRDDIRTGKVTAEEVGDAMEIIQNAGASEGWDAVTSKTSTSKVSAFSPASDKATYCSPDHQQQMVLPENKEEAEKEKHFLCDDKKLGNNTSGGAQGVDFIEQSWKDFMDKSPQGVAMSNLFKIYRGTGIAGFYSAVNGVITSVIITPLLSAINAISPFVPSLDLPESVDKSLAAALSWTVGQFSTFFGLAPLDANSPGGVFTNQMVVGAAATAEFAARNQGAAVTNQESLVNAKQQVALFRAEEYENSGVFERYFALSNPKSVASKGLFAIATNGFRSTISHTMGGILSGSIFVQTSAAEDDAYSVARFAGINTHETTNATTSIGVDSYDYPKECTAADPFKMTPANSTNADDMGYIPTSKLTWELVGNADKFYEEIYKNQPEDAAALEKIKQVYNCALMDSSVMGSLGALYNGDVLDSNAYGYTGSKQSGATQ